MKRKIFLACLIIFVNLLPASFSKAQEARSGSMATVDVVAAPQIFAERITIDQINETDKKITGSFTVSSQEDRDHRDVYWEISLFQVIQETLSAEKNLYDFSKWSLVASYPNLQPVIVKSRETEEKKYSLDLPDNRPLGNYLLQVKLYKKEGYETGTAVSSIFQLNGNNQFLRLSHPNVIKNDREYSSQTGIDFSQDEKPRFATLVRNISERHAEAYARVFVFSRNQFGKKISQFQPKEALSLSAGQQNFYKFELPAINQAGSFLVELQFFNKADNLPVSSPVHFRFVARGESGKILELASDKDSYQKDEQSLVSVKVIGSADSVLLNEKGIWVENPERAFLEANLEIQLLSLKDKSVIGQEILPVVLGSKEEKLEAPIPLKENTDGYILRAVLSKDGKVLDEKEINIPSKKQVSEIKKKKANLLLPLLMVVFPAMAAIGYAAYRLIRRKKVGKIFLLLACFSSIFSFCFLRANSAGAYTVIENWSSPAPNQRYNTTSNSSDVISFRAVPEVQGCSNEIKSVGSTGFYINDELKSSGLAGYSLATVNSGARLGANTATLKLDIETFGGTETYQSSRTFYVDTAKVRIGVYEDTGRGLRRIAGASVVCGSRSGTTGSDGSLELFSVPPGSMTCTASAAGYSSNSTTVTVSQIVNYGSIMLSPLVSPSCSLSFSPSSITAGQSTTATWSSVNDADGILQYRCTGNIGEGTVASSGSYVVTPTATQTCTVTVQNSAGQTDTCQATVTVGGPSCSLSFSPSSITAGQSTTATWSSVNDADGILQYRCTGNIGEGTVESSGSSVVTPTATQTCTVTAQNSAGQTGTCQATVTVGSAQTVGGYMCGVGYNCQSCPSLGSGACVYDTLSYCQSYCQRPDPPTCSCQLNPNSISQGDTTTLFWRQNGDSDGNLVLSLTGAYLGWEYRSSSIIKDHRFPRCTCDTTTTAQDCPRSFPASDADAASCYDQYTTWSFTGTTFSRSSPYSYVYTKNKVTSRTLQPVNPVYEYIRSSIFTSWLFATSPLLTSTRRYTQCSCDKSPLTADCPQRFVAASTDLSAYCYDLFQDALGTRAYVYSRSLAWNSSQVFSPLLDSPSNPRATFTLTARNDGGSASCNCNVDINPVYTLKVSVGGNGQGTISGNGSSINCSSGDVGTCQGKYAAGKKVTLSASASPGSEFAGWSGGSCSGNALTCSLAMDSDKTVGANFNTTFNPECTCSDHASYCPGETWNDSCGSPICTGGSKDCSSKRFWREVQP